MITVQEESLAALQRKSLGSILKSTMLFGGASLVTVLMGMIRGKVLAILLGVSGVGLYAIFQSLSALSANITNLGLASSAVRQIASAEGVGNRTELLRSIQILRSLSWALGVVGGGLLMSLAIPINLLSFGEDNFHTCGVVLIGLTAIVLNIAAANTAILRGLRQINELITCEVLSSIIGLIGSVILYWYLREDGIALGILFNSLVMLFLAQWYTRRLEIITAAGKHQIAIIDTFPMVRLGLAFMLTDLVRLGGAYATRILLARISNIETVGFFSAAWSIAAANVGFVLTAMAKDYYPKLAGAAARSDDECRRLINDQTEVALLLAVPAILALLALAPIAIRILFSIHFTECIPLLQWQIVGSVLTVVSWPLCFIPVVKGRNSLYLLLEFLWHTAFLTVVATLFRRFGLELIGVAFTGAYLMQLCLAYIISKRLLEFSWSPENKALISISIIVLLTEWLATYFLTGWSRYIFCGMITVGYSCFALHRLENRLSLIRSLRDYYKSRNTLL